MKKIDIILIIILVVNLLFFIYLVKVKQNGKIYENDDEIEPEFELLEVKDREYDEISSEIFIENMSEIKKNYTYKEPIAKIAIKIEDFLNKYIYIFLENRYNMMVYYNNNKDNIKELIGIDNYEEYEELVQKIKNINNKKIVSSEIIKNSSKIQDDRIIANIKIILEDNTNIILNICIYENGKNIKIY